MSKGEKKYLAIISLLIVGLFAMEYLRPKPIDWTHTFSKEDKIPFGAKALYQLLPTLLTGQNLADNQRTFYELEDDYSLEAYNSIILINQKASFGKNDWEVLKGWIEEGGTFFLAAEALKMPDTVDIEVHTPFFYNWDTADQTDGLDSTSYHQMSNPKLQEGEGYWFKKRTAINFFEEINTAQVKILAVNGNNEPTFIEIPWGQGRILWHCNPILFTNYNLLAQNNHTYIAKCFSYLPSQGGVLWDEYYKVGRTGAKTPLRVILSRPSLAWAWKLSLLTIFVFIIFNIKRKQRAITIVAPPKNTTLEFAETIGRLYLQHGDHRDLAHKMVIFFQDYVKRKLYLRVEEFTPQEAKQLAFKTGLDLDWVREFFKKCHQVRNSKTLSEEEMKKLHQLLSNFYKSIDSNKNEQQIG